MKTFLRWLLVVFGLLYLTLLYFWNFSRPDFYRRCDLYTERMNGGVHTFEGQDYKIELCGLNGGIEPENWHHDEVRLQVFAMDGELLAERFYEPILGSQFAIKLDYGDTYLVYNDVQGRGYHTKMAMPPSRWEWIRARLPRMWL